MALIDDLVAAAGDQDLPVGVGERPAVAGTGPFVVVWPNAPARFPLSLGRPQGHQTTTFVCHCMGFTPESALIAERKLAVAVTGLYRTTTDDGRFVQFPEQISSGPLQRDDDVSPPLFDVFVEWRVRTTPAP